MQRSFLLRLAVCAFTVGVLTSIASAQFPGLSPSVKRQLLTAKRFTPLALPTWIPAGFEAKRVHMVLGPRVKIEDKQLIIVYSRTLPNGRLQRFAFEAGFDGLGDLMYDGGKKISTPIGNVWLYYQPKDEDGKNQTDFAMTEWFNVGRTAWHYIGAYGTEEEGGDKLSLISLAETERMLRSLRRY
jgi:hypothetical protein